MDLSKHDAVVDLESSVDEELIKAGTYNVEVISSEGKPLGNNGGILCEFTVKILENGKMFRDGFWVAHNNPQSVEIGLGNLARFAKACGHSGVLKNTDDLNGMKLNVKVEMNDSGYPQFVNKSFRPFEDNEEVVSKKTSTKKKSVQKDSDVDSEDIPF